ncbi:DUF6483 family protein [Massiliimalia timonensis]|uniref:DUF6483 family protein n=1 Tax=Massiliimalia timonensis TaxID=1987501 RepID=UPI00189F1C17|nr:DUF6483 family protein [Massiliimalia timonensis]
MICDYEKDWFMRQISDMVRVVALTVFQKDRPEYKIEEETTTTSSDDLYRHTLKLLESREYQRALDHLSQNLSSERLSDLLVALDFYDRVNRLTEEELARYNLSREELLYSLQTIITLYELPF